MQRFNLDKLKKDYLMDIELQSFIVQMTVLQLFVWNIFKTVAGKHFQTAQQTSVPSCSQSLELGSA